MTPGLATLLGWTSCFAAAMLVALLRWRADRRVGVVAIVVGSLAIAMILASVGTVMLASAVFVWGCVVAGRVWRADETPVSSPSMRTSTRYEGDAALEAPQAIGTLERVALLVAWLLVGVVGIGTVVRLYVTFGADLSLHPTFGVNTIVLRRIFVDQPVLPMLLTLALLLRTVGSNVSMTGVRTRGSNETSVTGSQGGGEA